MEEVKGSISPNPDIIAMQKEWDEISCPICLDHPHNAVLLICRSHENGCRSFICDTSYRHSNCLDRFKKLRPTYHGNNSPPSTGQELLSNSFLTNPTTRRNSIVHVGDNNMIAPSLLAESMAESDSSQHGRDTQQPSTLNCPLCREAVSGWTIVKETRQYLDLKPRSCSRELCAFSGNYRELRRHARRTHPATRPADIDPSRQRAWRRLESEREYGDIVSAIRSAMPGAVVLGDYVIDGSNDLLPRRRAFGDDRRSWLTTLFLLRAINRSFIGLLDDEPRGSSRVWRTMSRRSHGHHNDDDDDDLNPDDVMISRRRRRFTRSTHNEEQHR